MIKKLSFLITLLALIAYLSGGIFKILHLPGAELLITGGIMGFVIGFPLMVYFLWPSFDKYMLISCGVSFMLICLSAVFKVLHLAGAPFLLLAGLVIFAFVFLPILFHAVYKQTEIK